jgi:curved DNA-binding protein CbpA
MGVDYYAVLGLQPGAGVAEIKRAYRRLARRHHPGINPGDREAEALFQRISEAYETLVDPERRHRYDAAGAGTEAGDRRVSEFTGFDFTVAARGPQAATFSELFAEVLHPTPAADRGRAEAGADLHATISLSFEDALRGVERQVVVMRQIECGACRVPRRRRSADPGDALLAVSRRRQDALGTRTYGVYEGVLLVRRDGTGKEPSLSHVRGAGALGAERRDPRADSPRGAGRGPAPDP